MDDLLRDARLKRNRARQLLETLRTELLTAYDGEPQQIPLVKELDEETGDLHVRFGEDLLQPLVWAPIVGDILHNLRSALDNGWWQLARKHLGREPSEKEARQISFPILKPGSKFDSARSRELVGVRATAFAERLQQVGTETEPSFLQLLAKLSNKDKHQAPHFTVQLYGDLQIPVRWIGPPPGPPMSSWDMSLPGSTFHLLPPDGPEPGTVAVTIPSDCWIRGEGFEFSAQRRGAVSIDGKTDIVWLLGQLQGTVADMLDAMRMLLDGDAVKVSLSQNVWEMPGPPPAAEVENFELPESPGAPILRTD